MIHVDDPREWYFIMLFVDVHVDTEEVLAKVQVFHTLHDEYCEWLNTSEQTLKDCLPIEANSTKLDEQQQIFEVNF